MPYTAWDQVNPAIKGIKPRLTLAMANHIAAMADAIAKGDNPPDSPWAVAIATFYQEYKRSGGRWVRRFEEVIRNIGGKWYLYTADGKKRLGGPYDKRTDALRRERQVQYFKKHSERLEGDMPYLNFHAARVRDPGDFKPGSFRNKTLPKSEGGKGGVQMIMGRLKGKTTMTVQAYRFPKDKYTPAEAKAWLKDNDVKFISFEPAKEAPAEADLVVEAIPEATAEDLAALHLEEGDWRPEEWKDTPMVPWNAKSFADVEMATSAKEATDQVHCLTYQFGELARNILNDANPDLTSADKLAGLRSLADEYLTRVEEIMMSVETPETTPPAGEAEPAAGAESIQAEMSEMAFGHALRLVEDDPGISPPAGGSIVPMALDVAFIEPGWGNEQDKHYYPAEVLKRDAHVFEGAKMYETDHRPQEKSTRTWVSTIREIAGFTETGAPVARVIVHDEDFAKRLKALSEGTMPDGTSMLEKMECSILALGAAKKGKIDGKEANIVERITEAQSVDWVTRAGAGGRALKLTEGESGMKGYRLTFKIKGEVKPANDAMLKALNGALGTVVEGAELADVVLAEVEEPVVAEPEADGEKPPVVVEPVAGEKPPEDAVIPPAAVPAPVLTAEAISAALEATNLPAPAKARLMAAGCADEASLKAAIGQETEYVKALTGSGKPFAQGPSRGPDAGKAMTEAEYAAAMDGILKRHGVVS